MTVAINPLNKTRFGEPAKFLPIAFICFNIGILWIVYTVYHCIPLLQQADTYHHALVQTVVFNIITLLLVTCYARCILTHPGTIPEKDEQGNTEWEYVPHDMRSSDSSGLSLQETKRSGDRRHCKWCNKYKPDRCHHCRVCRTCVLRMDHHCPWIYNCVGFCNHKYFFLLLLYSAIACHIVIWSMYGTLKEAIVPESPFLQMFMLLFGETLACFLGFMVTFFFAFHIWLMVKAMTTIEFCEKSMKRTGYDANVYDRGLHGNVRAVLGDDVLLWLLPCSPPSGDGLVFITEEVPLLHAKSKDLEAGRGMRKQMHDNAARKHRSKRSAGAGTGECGGSEGEESDAVDGLSNFTPSNFSPQTTISPRRP